MGCDWCKCFWIPWCYLQSNFSKFYTYVCGYVHSVFAFFILFTGILLQAFFKTDFAKPFSLFTPPQFLRRPPPLILDKQKARISPGLRIKIQFSTMFWSNRIRTHGACVQNTVPIGNNAFTSTFKKLRQKWKIIDIVEIINRFKAR